MKRKLISLLCVLILFFPVFILGQGNFYSEKIRNFSVEFDINKDSSLLIKESILYDFGENLKHGIYRDIPLGNIKIKVLKVIDEFSDPYPFKVSKEGKYLRIKIGDPNKLIKGTHTYNIFYRVDNEIGYFNDRDELYWNVTGHEWEVPIERAGALIHLPEKVFESDLKFDCFTGFFGSKEKNCNYRMDEDGDIIFESKSFNPREGLTIVLGWPKGLVKEPSLFKKFLWNFEKFYPFLIPIFVFLYLFREWWYKGKDPKIKKTIIAQYEPPDNLRPAEVSLVLRQKVSPKDISATLIDLAVRGYIKIREIKKSGIFSKTDYQLIKLKDFNDLKKNLKLYERGLLRNVFEFNEEVLVSGLKNRFYSHLPNIMGTVYYGIPDFKYFISNPKEITKKWSEIGIGILVLGLFLAFLLNNFLLLNPIFISGILFLIFSPFMPKRTEKGTEAYWQILGFKEYINTAEKYRAEFEEKENIFEKYLPYAIIFGLVDKWAKAFEGIYNRPPSWYEGDFGPQFSTFVFVNSMNRSLFNVNSAFVSRPGGGVSGFGGGGFAGGGGGGGGGGSW